MTPPLEARIAQDVVNHTMSRVQQIVNDAHDLMPDDHLLDLYATLAVQTLYVFAEACAKEAPVFRALDKMQQFLVLSMAFGRSMGITSIEPGAALEKKIRLAARELKPVFEELHITIGGRH